MTFTTFTRNAVAGEVRAALARANMKQAELARQIRLSPAGLSERLNGDRAFTTDDLAEIAEVLGVSPFTFLVPPAVAVDQQGSAVA